MSMYETNRNWYCGWQWPPQFGYFVGFYDGLHRVLHLGPFWIEYYS
jgi:hypothetical protein